MGTRPAEFGKDIETGAKQALETKIPRGNFIKGFAALGASLRGPAPKIGSVGIIGYAAFELAKQAPFVTQPKTPEGEVLFPGWIGYGYPYFIEADHRGHERWMRYAIFESPSSSPLLLPITQRLLERFNTNLVRKERIGLDEVFESAMNISSSVLNTRIRLGQVQNPELKAAEVSAALTCLAYICSSWGTKDDLRKAGVGPEFFSENQTVSDYYWGPNGLGRVVFPASLAVDGFEDSPTEEPKNGADKLRHITAGAMLFDAYLESATQKRDLHKSVPRAVAVSIDLARRLRYVKNNRDEGAFFVELLGLVYEGFTTFAPRNIPLGKSPRDIREGFGDDLVLYDLIANRVGALIAQELRKATYKGKSFVPIFNRLKDPQLASFDKITLIQKIFPGISG